MNRSRCCLWCGLLGIQTPDLFTARRTFGETHLHTLHSLIKVRGWTISSDMVCNPADWPVSRYKSVRRRCGPIMLCYHYCSNLSLVDDAVSVSCTGVVASSTVSSSAPYFTVEPRSSVVRRGNRILLHCTAGSTASAPSSAAESDADEPTHRGDISITWTHNGIALHNQSESWSSSSLLSTVNIASFGRSHEGLYQCVANNSVGAVVSRPATLILAGN